jgi:ribosome biogenesis GTPase A
LKVIFLTIQWFPGHMAKAKRQVVEKLKLIDVVIELVDARIPQSSRNPMIDEIIGTKPRLVLLNKADMADPKKTDEWIRYYKKQGFQALAIDSQTGKGMKQIVSTCQDLMEEKREKLKSKGVINMRAIRVLIIGIPNVGKSTLINRLAEKKAAKTGDRPGITTQQQWIKVGKELELLDTPGILWPKFDDPQVGLRLAVTGAIKDTLLDFQEITVFALKYLSAHYRQLLLERYKLNDIPDDVVELFDEIGKRRGCLVSGGLVDYDKTAELVIREIRTMKLGRVTFELPEEWEESAPVE